MRESDKKILLVIASIAILVLAFMFVVKPKNEDCKALQSEIVDLQARLDDLTAKESQKDQFIQETKEFNEKFDEVVAKYPADLNQESTVMFLKGVEESNEFVHDSFQMPRETIFYVLGEGQVERPEDVDTSDEESEKYVCSQDAYTVAYNGTYDGLKDYLDYIANYKYRMAISQIAIQYDSEADTPIEECTGSITLNAYSISGPDRESDVPNVSVQEGKENIFAGSLGLNGGGAAVSYDSDGGAGIVSNHNLVVLLNNANNDTSSGIIVASSESNESTYVSSSANSVQALNIDVTEEDGKKYVTYSIGADSKKAEILSSDLTIFVKSASRVDAEDKNGIDVNITNNTDLGVYFKVEGDDSSSPRFNIKSKSGKVKVY